jgi:hypothetical protein
MKIDITDIGSESERKRIIVGSHITLPASIKERDSAGQ